MLISALMIGTLKIELISKNIFTQSYNNFNKQIIDTINIGSYEDIINIEKSLIIKKDMVSKNIKFLTISLKSKDNIQYNRYRMFYER
jgi:hypothetical protein